MQCGYRHGKRQWSLQHTETSLLLTASHCSQVSKVFHLHVLGKGPDRLGLPQELMQHVTLHRRLQYRPFYAVISKTVALVPSLANPR